MQTSRGGNDEWVTPWPGASVLYRDRTASTMDDALALARAGCPAGTVAAAGSQDTGRGRVPGRAWLSAPGESLLATVVLRVRDLGFPLHELPLRAGAAAALGIEEAAGVRVQVKWPNDIMSSSGGPFAARKLCGLLCEARGDAVHGDAALIGIGVNCLQASFPPEIQDSACSLRQCCGRAVSPPVVLAAFLTRLRQAAAGDGWLEQVRARLFDRGRVVRVSLTGSQRVVEGVLRDVDERGRLVVQLSDGRRETLSHGELVTIP